MVMRPVAVAFDHPQIRAIQRISVSYTVSHLELLLKSSGVDPLDTLILLFVAAKNFEGINNSRELTERYSAWSDIPPDAIRQPISRRALAGSIGISVETARRRIEALIRRGLLVEVEGGVIVPGGSFDDLQQSQAIFSGNFQLFRRMISQFRAHKIDLNSPTA